MAQDHSDNQSNLFQAVVGHLGLLFRLERRILGLIVSYSIAIGLFSLIVPLTVQELVNTFAFALQPITIVTLAAVMVAGLLFVGAFRALQYYAVEVLERRIFARVAIAMAQQLPHLRYQGFKPRYANYFVETILMQRAVSVLLVDLINVIVGGTGTFVGALYGSALLTALKSVVGSFTAHHAIVIGALFVVSVIFFPKGLVGYLAPALERLWSRR